MAALLLVCLSIPLFWLGAQLSSDAWSCTRGEDCMGPFAGYFILGVPALAAGGALVVAALWLCAPRRVRTAIVRAGVVTMPMVIAGLTTGLWTK